MEGVTKREDLAEECTIRLMTRDEWHFAMKWFVEIWNESEEYMTFLFDLESSTFYAAKFKGEIIGCYAVFNIDESIDFIGLLYVKEEFRCKGIGTKLRIHILKSAKNIACHSIEAEVFSHAKLGVKESKFKTTSFYGCPDKQVLESYNVAIRDLNVAPLDDSMMQQVIEYDASIITIPRPKYLRVYLKQEKSITYVAMQQSTGAIQGYGTLWPSFKDFRLSPLYANTPEIAKLLLYNLLQHTEFVEILVPIENKVASKIVKELNMEETQFHFVLMYTKAPATVAKHKVFSISSLEASHA